MEETVNDVNNMLISHLRIKRRCIDYPEVLEYRL